MFLDSKDVIRDFELKNKDIKHKTSNPEIRYINPQRIVGINNSHTYKEMMTGSKMRKLRKSVELNGWTDEEPYGINLLEFPNGDIVVRGSGNHRAVLSKLLGLQKIKANVAVYIMVKYEKGVIDE